MSISRLVGAVLALAVIAGPSSAEDSAALDDLIDAAHRLSPALRAAALGTAAMAAKAEGAGALDDPMLSDSYQYYRDPGVFSGHAITVSQFVPLWGKRDLKRDAALSELAAARGRERAAQDELDERIRGAFARYAVASHAVMISQEAVELSEGVQQAATARYAAGRGLQAAILQWMAETVAARADEIKYQADRDAARVTLNALLARPADTAIPEPGLLPRLSGDLPPLETLIDRARSASPSLEADSAEIDATRTRRTLADKEWYPDVTIGAGPLIQTNGRAPGIATTIGLTIPLGWGRQASEQKAAAASAEAAEQRYQASLSEIEAALGEASARFVAATRTIELIEGEALPRTRAAVRSVLADYSEGRGELATAIMALHRHHDLEFQLLRAQLDAQISLAAIERLVGDKL